MIPYFFISISAALSAMLYKRKYNIILSDSIFIFMLAIVCFRGNSFGLADYDNYKIFYDKVITWNDVVTNSVSAEIGFRFFSYVGNVLNFESQFIIVIMGLLSSIPVYSIIRKYSVYKSLALFFWLPYFLTFNMHSSRTAVAAGFGVLFFNSFFNRRYIKTAFYFIAAISFHKAGLILLLVFLTLFNIKLLFLSLLLVSIFVSLFYPLDLVVFVFNKLGLHSYSYQVTSYRGGYFGYSIPIYDPRILISMVFSYLGYRMRPYLDNRELYFLKLFVVGVIVFVAFSEVVIMAWRGSYFFLISGIVVVPFIARYYSLKIFYGSSIKQSLVFFVVFSYGSYLFYLIIKGQPYVLYGF